MNRNSVCRLATTQPSELCPAGGFSACDGGTRRSETSPIRSGGEALWPGRDGSRRKHGGRGDAPAGERFVSPVVCDVAGRSVLGMPGLVGPEARRQNSVAALPSDWSWRSGLSCFDGASALRSPCRQRLGGEKLGNHPAWQSRPAASVVNGPGMGTFVQYSTRPRGPLARGKSYRGEGPRGRGAGG